MPSGARFLRVDDNRVFVGFRTLPNALVAVAADAHGAVTLVSADRELRRRVEALGADVAGPGWLLALLDE
jgi:hypothetical protein